MGSLYEPSIRSSTWSVFGKHLSQRFTTLEGWREIGQGIYSMGNSNIRMFSMAQQFDHDHTRDDDDFDVSFTTPGDAPPVPPMPDAGDKKIKSMSLVSYRRSTIFRAVGPAKDFKSSNLGLPPMVMEEEGQDEAKTPPPEVYHLFTGREKWSLWGIAAAAGFLPAFTFNIILPSLVTIATDLKVSLEALNLSIMFFLLIQAAAPVIWGPLSDSLGRRPVYIYSLLILIITSVNLSFSISYPTYLVFKGLQAFGVASLVAIGASVIQDITPVAERELVFSFYHIVRNTSLVVAPVIGGVMTNFVNFRCLFTLLSALSVAIFMVVLLFLPETHRPIAGNGSLPLKGMHKPLVWRWGGIFGGPAHLNPNLQPGYAPSLKLHKFLEPLKLLTEIDIILNLTFSSVIFAIWVMVTVSTAGLFKTVFELPDVLLGLVFVPNALGTIAGSTLIGNLLNSDFAAASMAYREEYQLPSSVVISKHALPSDFPLEHTRLIRLPGLTILFIITLSFYGFTLMYPSLTSISGWVFIPLLLQFLIAVMSHAICGVHQTLISDLWPVDSTAASAASNIVKWVAAAVGVAIIQRMLEGLDVGPTFLALALVVIILVPVLIIQWYWGGTWRRRREEVLVQKGIVEKSQRVFYV